MMVGINTSWLIVNVGTNFSCSKLLEKKNKRERKRETERREGQRDGSLKFLLKRERKES